MTDRRTLAANGRVAHETLRGLVEAERFVEGHTRQVSAPVADLCASPGGPRDRQLLMGERFQGLDTVDGWCFGICNRDGYVGWIAETDLSQTITPVTHVITAARSYGKTTPGLKNMGHVIPLPFGAGLHVLEEANGWAQVHWEAGGAAASLYLPLQHLAPATELATDPVAVAARFLGTPYLWGGNSSFGVDCSGLVQAALLACGVACPGDSDQQEIALGAALAEGAPYQRGDLLFWRGHVAFVSAPDQLLHANAHHMAVVEEPLEPALRRIATSDTGPVTSHKRLWCSPNRPPGSACVRAPAGRF